MELVKGVMIAMTFKELVVIVWCGYTCRGDARYHSDEDWGCGEELQLGVKSWKVTHDIKQHLVAVGSKQDIWIFQQ